MSDNNETRPSYVNDKGDNTVRVLHARLNSGEISAQESVESAINRIAQFDGDMHSVVVPLFERALDQLAKQKTRAGPLCGIPMLLKDAGEELANTPHYCGLSALRDSNHRSQRTTPLVNRFESLGASIVGRSAAPAFSAGVTTEPSGFDPTQNPVAPGRVVGGSSGGSAAAVAKGLVPFAHGSDATGSLRFPAACCGLATLNPTRGRTIGTPPAGQPDPGRIWRSFVLTNDVADLAFLWPYLAADPKSLPTTKRLRIGFLMLDVATGLAVVEPCRHAVQLAATALEALGHIVEEAHPSALDALLVRTGDAINRWGNWGRREQIDWLATRLGRPILHEDLDETLWPILDSPGQDPLRIVHDVQQVLAEADAMLPWWDTFDLLLTPTMRRLPWRIGQPAGGMQVGGFCSPFSFSGQPSLVLPVPHSDQQGDQRSDDLPRSVQLVGAHGTDELLLQLGIELEVALGP